MIVPVTNANKSEWLELCTELWCDFDVADESFDDNYLYYSDGEAIAFIQLALRHDYVEGTDSSPVGYVEGIYVNPKFRSHGIARELIEFAKRWSRERGCTELASDCLIENEDSRRFHNNVGFEETNIIVCFKMII